MFARQRPFQSVALNATPTAIVCSDNRVRALCAPRHIQVTARETADINCSRSVSHTLSHTLCLFFSSSSSGISSALLTRITRREAGFWDSSGPLFAVQKNRKSWDPSRIRKLTLPECRGAECRCVSQLIGGSQLSFLPL